MYVSTHGKLKWNQSPWVWFSSQKIPSIFSHFYLDWRCLISKRLKTKHTWIELQHLNHHVLNKCPAKYSISMKCSTEQKRVYQYLYKPQEYSILSPNLCQFFQRLFDAYQLIIEFHDITSPSLNSSNNFVSSLPLIYILLKAKA